MEKKHPHFIEHYNDILKNHKNKNIKSIIKKYTKTPYTGINSLIEECLGRDSYIEYDRLGKNISGKIELINGRYIITVNKDHPGTRRRFTLAHEFAHYVLHSDKIGKCIVDDELYRSNKPLGFLEEVRANRFAGKILMPMEHINTLAKRGFNFGEVATELGVSNLALKVRLGIAGYDPSDDIIKLASKL